MKSLESRGHICFKAKPCVFVSSIFRTVSMPWDLCLYWNAPYNLLEWHCIILKIYLLAFWLANDIVVVSLIIEHVIIKINKFFCKFLVPTYKKNIAQTKNWLLHSVVLNKSSWFTFRNEILHVDNSMFFSRRLIFSVHVGQFLTWHEMPLQRRQMAML